MESALHGFQDLVQGWPDSHCPSWNGRDTMTRSTSESLRFPSLHTSMPITTTGINEVVRKNTRDSLDYGHWGAVVPTTDGLHISASLWLRIWRAGLRSIAQEISIRKRDAIYKVQ